MLDTIKTMILDFQETSLEHSVPRRIPFETVSGKASVFVGVRRAGKSTYLFQIIRRLLDSGVSVHNILFINFFDDRLYALRHEPLGLIIDAYFSLYPEKKNTEVVYCFFDEIQSVQAWEPFVDRLLRTEKCEIYLTGSSAQMLSKDISTQMRGRALSWEIFPFSFVEYLDSQGIKSDGPWSTKKQLVVAKQFNAYWESGGFPEVLNTSRLLRIKIHQDYFTTILFRDLVERNNISHPQAAVDLAHWLLANTACSYSVNRLTGYLKSLGHKIPKSSVVDYLGWLEDAYFMFTVEVFDASMVRRKANPKRIYCIDHAFAASISPKILTNSGHALENLVFMGLKRIFSEIYYYKTKSAKEVDFVIVTPGSPPHPIQVCESLHDPQTRKREVTALLAATEEMGIGHGTIVTRNEQEHIEIGDTKIQVLPAWWFLLDPQHCLETFQR